MLEQDYKRAVINALRTMGWSIQEHEDRQASFIPDLSFGAHGVDGWIEVKYRDKMPPLGLGSIRHYTKGQEDWLIDRAAAGSGACYLLLGTATGGYVWHHSALRNARSATWVGAQSLCCCRALGPEGYVLPIAECLNALIIGRKK